MTDEVKTLDTPAAGPDASVSRVLVTGATGYIASHAVLQLLKAGYKVRGTVRSLKNAARLQYLRDMPNAAANLELVEAELLNDASWPAAVEGCSHIMHMASPFPDKEPEDEAELLRPAVEGTLSVLRAAAATNGQVKRIVLTSSQVAVGSGYPEDRARVFNETDWSVVENCKAYPKSKTLAERAAWDFVSKLPEGQKFELTTINPSFVMGPPLSTNAATSTSCTAVARIMKKEFPFWPNINFTVVDVRDVARAHVVAMTHPAAAGERFLCVNGLLPMPGMAQLLANEFNTKGYSLSANVAPKFALWMLCWFDKAVASIYPILDKVENYSNDKIKEKLGITFIDHRTTLVEMAYEMIRLGLAEDHLTPAARAAAGLPPK